jgi:hypothetical protein
MRYFCMNQCIPLSGKTRIRSAICIVLARLAAAQRMRHDCGNRHEGRAQRGPFAREKLNEKPV